MIKKAALVSMLFVLFAATAMSVTVTVDDIIKLHKEGLSVDTIKSFIETSGQVFELTANDLIKLKKAGVPDEVIKVMLATKKKASASDQSGAATTVGTNASPPTLVDRISGTKKKQVVIVVPKIPHLKMFSSIFYLSVHQKKRVPFPPSKKLAEVGSRNPLNHAAERAGTLFLTEDALLMCDADGKVKFKLPYKEISRIKIKNRYPSDIEGRRHPLDRYELKIEFVRGGKKHLAIAFALPKPEKPPASYGSVIDIANALHKAARAKNPRLQKPKRLN